MSEDLKQRLDRLAAYSPVVAPPDDLWRRGVRRRRGRLAAGVAASAVAAVLVGALAGISAHSIDVAPAQPASGEGVGAIPTRVDAPSPWLPDGDASSPTSPLAVVMGAERKSLLGASSSALVGVSAGSGTYRWLDLPDRVVSDDSGGEATDVALSPSGRWVAYWQQGPVGTASDPRTGVVAAAAYDTGTGAVRRLPLESRLGAAAESLGWVDDDRLLVGWAAVTSTGSGQSTARVQPSLLWAPGGRVREVGDRLTDLEGLRPAPGGVSASDGRALELLDRDLRTTARHPLGLTEDQSVTGEAVVCADRSASLVVSDSEAGRSRLLTGPLPGSRNAPMELRAVDVGRLSPEAVLAGGDARHLLVLGHEGGTRGVYSVDTVTGRSDRVVAVPGQSWLPGIRFASELWDRAPVERPGPPWTPDPRVVAVAAAAAVLLGCAWWRRRRGLA